MRPRLTSLLSVGTALPFLFPCSGRCNANDGAQYSPQPYMIDVSAILVEETRVKAANYRQTLDIAAPPWYDGPPTVNVSQVAEYMASDYDWFAFQDQVNANFSHYFTTIPAPGDAYPHDLGLHFIHQRSERADAIPILLLHGWPSTSLEWEKVIRPLTAPPGPSNPAFHVVAPDLPGYGFSPAPLAPGLGPAEHATVCARLMEQLGYATYAVYSTDLGFAVGLHMVDEYEERVVNHVTDFYLSPPNATDLERFGQNQTTAEESRFIEALNVYETNYSAYASIHRTFPLSIAHALNDSPVGFLAWMWQLDYLVRDLSVPYSMEELVSQAMTLFLPGVYGNIRSYKELFATIFSQHQFSRVPTSVTQWGYPAPSYPGVADFNFVVSSP